MHLNSYGVEAAVSGGSVVGLIILAIILLFVWAYYANKMKRDRLMFKYNGQNIVDLIMDHKIWQGMTAEQLADSWGNPAAKDHKVYKAKVAETFKYNQTGKNRFSSRVMLEDGVVVGWKQNG